MVISHKHKYIYVQLPQTACTTIMKELLENYEGEKILFKHALYSDFLKQASADEKKYFALSSLRNPLDIVVSKYFKYKTDHVGAYSEQRMKKFGLFHKYLLYYTDRARFAFIKDKDAEFGDFFKKFYTLPYSSWAILDHDKMDFVIRYEQLQDDFSKAVELIGMEQVRPLPTKNKTGGKDTNFWNYYDSPELQGRAKRLFSEYLTEFEYAFPKEWDGVDKASLSRFKYDSVNFMRSIYWRFLR